MSAPHPGRRARRDSADPVEDMRRQLARLGIEVEPEPLTRAGEPGDDATELARPARAERADPGARRIRSGAGDPQRAHPTGFADRHQSQYSAARTGVDHEEWGSGGADSLPTVVGGDDGRQADPVAAGSQPGEPDRRAGTRRLAPGDRPGATVDQAKDACLNLLAVRARSRAELEKRLGEKGFRLEVTAAALDRLAEVGLIDDTAFAEQWVHERHTYSGRGKRALQRELRDKGVAPAAAEDALAAVTDEAERARATDLVRRKLATLSRDLDRDKATRRLVGMLARRGYDQSTAFAVVTAELADAGFDRAPLRRPHGPGSTDGLSPATAAADGAAPTRLDLPGSLDRTRRQYEPETQIADGAQELPGDEESARSRGRSRWTRTARPSPDAPEGVVEPAPARLSARRPVPGDEHEAAELVRRKIRSLPADLDRAKATRRLVDMLARRGYSASVAYSVVKAELAASDR